MTCPNCNKPASECECEAVCPASGGDVREALIKQAMDKLLTKFVFMGHVTRNDIETAVSYGVDEALAAAPSLSHSPALAGDREARLVEVVGAALANLGSDQGYFPSIGSPVTRAMIAAYRAYGHEPEFGRSTKCL